MCSDLTGRTYLPSLKKKKKKLIFCTVLNVQFDDADLLYILYCVECSV